MGTEIDKKKDEPYVMKRQKNICTACTNAAQSGNDPQRCTDMLCTYLKLLGRHDMITITESARKELEAYFADKDKGTIRVYLAPGG